MTIFIRTIVFCLFSAVLWGCTGAPRFGDRPAAIQPPKSWTMPPGVASEWTAQSLDARLDPEAQLLIQQTLRANLDLRLALVRMEIAQNSLTAANGRRLPAAEFSLRAGRERQVVDKDAPIRTSSFSRDMTVRWELDLWGRLHDQARASDTELAAAAQDVEAARRSLAAQTLRLWGEIIGARSQERLAEEHLESLHVGEKVITERFSRGLAPVETLNRIRMEKAAADDEIENRRRQSRQLVRALTALLGLESDVVIDIKSSELPDAPQPPLDTLPAGLLERRPDIRAAKMRVLAADLHTSGAEKALLPDISLTAALGSLSHQVHRLAHPSATTWSLGAGLLQPVFQGGRLRAEIRGATLEAEQAWIQFSRIVHTAVQDVGDCLDTETALHLRLEVAGRRLVLSQAAESLAWKAYLAGEEDLPHALAARRQVILARQEKLAIRTERFVNGINLALALGEDMTLAAHNCSRARFDSLMPDHKRTFMNNSAKSELRRRRSA